MYNARAEALEKHGLTVARSLVGNYVTSLDMAGCSITVSMLDDETTRLVGRAGPHGGAALGDVEQFREKCVTVFREKRVALSLGNCVKQMGRALASTVLFCNHPGQSPYP